LPCVVVVCHVTFVHRHPDVMPLLVCRDPFHLALKHLWIKRRIVLAVRN
jgi:hypothetical protein